MAEFKKFMDLTALGTLVDQIKAEDAKVLAAAEKYTDDAGKLYDAAGSAESAKQAAIADADAKFAVVNENIGKKADATSLEAEVTRATNKENEIVASVEAVDAKAVKNAEDIAAINDGTNGILAQAKKYADDEDAKVEALVSGVAEDVADLAEYVGTFTSENAKSVVEYIDEKTTGIATDATVNALADRVTQAEKDIDAIEADYLKAADKTALEGKITAEETRATEAEAGLAARIKAVEDDYLVEADKTELEGKINVKADKTALDAEIERATGVEEGLQNQINLIMNNPDTKDVIDSIAEFTAYVEEHGEIADGFRTDIDKNKDDIAAMDTAYKAADTEIKGRLDVLEAINHEAYVAADTALKNELNGEIAKKADSTALAEAVEALEGADSALSGRLDAVEAMLGDGDDSVSEMIATAKQEAIDAAAADAKSKADKALEDAKAYADAEDAKIESRVGELETASATHALKSEVEAVAGRVTTIEGKVSTLEGEMDAVEALAAANKAAHEANAAAIALKASQADLEAAVARVAKNEGDIVSLNATVATKADADDLNDAVARIAKNETDIAAVTSSVNSFTAITSAEVEALFA